MSEEQRLINWYIKDLTIPSSTAYMLHFLKSTTDQASKIMLRDSLSKIQVNTKNEQLSKILSNIESNPNIVRSFGRHSSNSSDNEDSRHTSETNYSSQAKLLLSQLKLDDALKMFVKSVHEKPEEGKFYRERAELCLILNNCKKAISLSNKGHDDDIIFAAAIAEGDFTLMQNRLEVFVRIITKNLYDFKRSVISRYEFELLLIIFCFARLSSRGLKLKSTVIFENSNYTHENLKKIVNLFENRDFQQFLSKLPEIEEMLNLSIYSSRSCSKFIESIKENVVINEILPLSFAKLEDIQQKFDIPIEKIKLYVMRAIRSQRLNGKLDLVQNAFIGGITNLLNVEIDNFYNRALTDLYDIKFEIWKKQYNTENTPKREELALKDKKALDSPILGKEDKAENDNNTNNADIANDANDEDIANDANDANIVNDADIVNDANDEEDLI